MTAKVTPKNIVVITLAVVFLGVVAYVRFWPDSPVANAVGPEGVVFGKQTAPVTVVAFLSPMCSHCQDFEAESAPVLYQAAAAGVVRYVVYPVKTGFASDQDMTEILCASEQNAFAPYLKLRFEQPVSAKALSSVAGLNPKRFSRCLGNRAVRTQAIQIAAWAKHLNVQATPTFYVQDAPASEFRKVEGDKGVDFWQALSKLQGPRERRSYVLPEGR